MSRSRRAAVGLALALLALTPEPASGQEGFTSAGGTTVTVEGSVATITVTIDLIVGGIGTEELPEGAQEAGDALASEIEAYWNQGLARYATDCLELRLDVVINVLPNTVPPPSVLDLGEGRPITFVTTPGHHVVFYAEGNHYGNIPPPETYDPYDDDGIAPPGEDYGSPYRHEQYAIWSPHLEDSRDLAHEFGHLLGFGDDYDENGPLPGREGTLMDHGDLIDLALVNRLAALIRDSGTLLPECWEGTVGGEIYNGTVGEAGVCRPLRVPIHGTVSFAVDDDGAVTGHWYSANDPYECGILGDPANWQVPSTPIEFDFTGERTADGFTLDVFGDGSLTLVRDGNVATGEIVLPGGQDSSTTYTVSAECVGCAER